MSDHSLESKDLEILRVLQRNASLSNAEVAEQLNLSASACYRRVRALIDRGFIRTQVAVLDPATLGLDFHAVVHVSLSRHEQTHVRDFVEAVTGRPEIIECFATTGEADFHLRVITKSANDYNAFLDDFLFRLPGISTIRTNLILKEIKQTTALPI